MKISRFNNDFAFLSNFYPCKVIYQGITYPSSEHAYQAAKTSDVEIKKIIAQLSTAGKAKRYGATLQKPKNWYQISVGIMFDILYTLRVF